MKKITRKQYNDAIYFGIMWTILLVCCLAAIGTFANAFAGNFDYADGVNKFADWSWTTAATGWAAVAVIGFVYWACRPNE